MTTLSGRPIGRALLAFALGGLAVTSASLAQTSNPDAPAAPDPNVGGAIADRLCASCHIVKPGQTSTITPGIPSFAAISSRPGQTREHIIQILIAPHGEMPDVSLTRAEIGHLLAYIDSLRDKSLPSLLPPVTPDAVKPKYPQPS